MAKDNKEDERTMTRREFLQLFVQPVKNVIPSEEPNKSK